jgi:hypothetical protein
MLTGRPKARAAGGHDNAVARDYRSPSANSKEVEEVAADEVSEREPGWHLATVP